MTPQPDLMSLVAFGADYDGDVWMWTNNPSSVNWTVTVRQKWDGIETRESPQRVTGLELELFGVIEWGEAGDRSVEPVEWVSPLSAWLVDRERVVAIEIDLGNGEVATFP